MKVILSCVYDDWTAAEMLFQAVDREFSQRDWKWHLVLVDDGSRQAAPPDFLKSVTSFASIEVLVLRRNVGNQRAIAIGLAEARREGEKVPSRGRRSRKRKSS